MNKKEYIKILHSLNGLAYLMVYGGLPVIFVIMVMGIAIPEIQNNVFWLMGAMISIMISTVILAVFSSEELKRLGAWN